MERDRQITSPEPELYKASRWEMINALHSEASIVTLIAMRSRKPITDRILNKRIYNLLHPEAQVAEDEEEGAVKKRNGLTRYFSYVPQLVRAGFVKEVGKSPRGGAQYMITPSGLAEGTLAAMGLVELFENSRIRLRELSGKYNAQVEKSAPVRRIRILELLLNSDAPLRRTDIANILDIPPPIVTAHLQHLNELNLIDYQSRRADHEVVSFWMPQRLGKEEADALGPTQKKIYQIYADNPDSAFTNHELEKAVRNNYPEMRDRKYLYSIVWKAHAFLESRGLLVRLGGYTQKAQSRAVLRADAQNFARRLDEVFEKYENPTQSETETARRSAKKLLADSLRLQRFVESAHANETDPQKRIEAIRKILADAKKRKTLLTSRGIQQELKKSKIEISLQTVQEDMLKLNDDGSVVLVESKTAYYWERA